MKAKARIAAGFDRSGDTRAPSLRRTPLALVPFLGSGRRALAATGLPHPAPALFPGRRRPATSAAPAASATIGATA